MDYESPKVTIAVEQSSPYLDSLPKAETVVVAKVAKKAPPSPKLTVKTTSGTRYGNAIRLYPDTQFNNCVAFAKAKTGISGSIGDGARKRIQGKDPRVGAIGSMRGLVHAVVVTAVSGNQVTFIESNYESGWITQRTAPTSMFLGFIYR